MSYVIQDRVLENFCWGCGVDNPDGLQLKSTWDGTSAVAEFEPQARFAAGPLHVLNGGIIATLIDCHAVCTAAADAYEQAGRMVGEGADLWFATASLSVEYLRPTSLSEPITIAAHVIERGKRLTRVECTLGSSDRISARASVSAVLVNAEWRHGAPAV